jgi:predicted DsbA family dithiol-disulfide isomerase
MENDQLAQSIGLKSAPTFILVRERKEPLGIVGPQSYSIFQKTISQLEKPQGFPNGKGDVYDI